ncbi:MAG: UDP-N-acetylglucosamine 1-carboxyvinyltransferase, partial [Oscillospiraceae bacterium]|nr:UDP-N-acetylglucosamine 1-carboxyvinyltransferase [Oscillospiraceae bacterium]
TVFIEYFFQNCYRSVEELTRLRYDIPVSIRVDVVAGLECLTGTSVSATDLRGGAAMVVAALGAEGETLISDIEHIDRGYDGIETTLGALGADIRRIEV